MNHLKKKQQKARNNAIPDGDMYSKLTIFFSCKNYALQLKLGEDVFAQVNVMRAGAKGQATTRRAQGGETKMGLAGED